MSSLRTRLSGIWWTVPVLLSYIVLVLTPAQEGDLWWHLRLGETIAALHALPQVDELTVAGVGLSYNAAHSWLSDLFLHVVARSGGLAALVTLQAVVAATTMVMLQSWNYRIGTAARSATTLNLVGFLCLYPFSTARPQIFSFLLFAAALSVVLFAHRGSLRWLLTLPFLMTLWVNLHGAWVMGLALIAVFEIGWIWEAIKGCRAWRHLRFMVLCGVMVLPAVLINPIGLGAFRYLVAMGSSPISQQFVSEWQPPALGQTFTWPFWGLLIVGGLLLALRRPRRWDLPLIASLCFVVLALRYLRMIPFAVITFLAALSSRLPVRRSEPERATMMNSLLLGLMILVSVLTTPYVRVALGASEQTFIDPYFPVDACDALRELVVDDVDVFTLAEWGGYVGWHLAPNTRPFVDGRVELPPVEVWEDYVQITTARPGWEARLRHWGIGYLLLSAERQGQLIVEARAAGWQTLYQDEAAILLVEP